MTRYHRLSNKRINNNPWDRIRIQTKNKDWIQTKNKDRIKTKNKDRIRTSNKDRIRTKNKRWDKRWVSMIP